MDLLEPEQPESLSVDCPEPSGVVQPQQQDQSGRQCFVAFVELVKVTLLAAIAAAMVVIAVAQSRQARIVERQDCHQRAIDFREDTGVIGKDLGRRIREACHQPDPLGRDR